jgi:hypothetical protein
MEMIFGVIEDLIERFKGNDAADKEDARNNLKSNMGSFIQNLESLAGNADAQKLLGELKALKLD